MLNYIGPIMAPLDLCQMFYLSINFQRAPASCRIYLSISIVNKRQYGRVYNPTVIISLCSDISQRRIDVNAS